MRQLHKKILAAAVMCASLLISLPVYGAQKAPVAPLTETVNTVSLSDNGPAGSKQTAFSRQDDSEYVNSGPGVKKEEADTSSGRSLGMFTITGYCGCPACSGGHNRTFSGTVPQPNHTISADLNVFPLGTRLMINGIIYTVEDKGSAVKGNKLDIFYGSHDEAMAAGVSTAEVFSAD